MENKRGLTDLPETFADWLKSLYSHAQLEHIAACGRAKALEDNLHYDDVTELYAKYKDDIWQIIKERAGNRSALEMISRLPYEHLVRDQDSLERLLFWYAVPELAEIITTKGRKSRGCQWILRKNNN